MKTDPSTKGGEGVSNRAATEEQVQRLMFLQMLADGGDLKMNGIPWRTAYLKLRAIIDRKPVVQVTKEVDFSDADVTGWHEVGVPDA